MVDNKNVSKKTKGAIETSVQAEDSGEYGLQQLLSPNNADMDEVRKRSGYHFTQDELQHKEDRVDKKKE